MPIKCFETKLKLQGGALTLPRSSSYPMMRITPASTFGRFVKMAKKNAPAWRYYEIDASHAPNVTAPEALMGLLEKIIADGGLRGWACSRRTPHYETYQPACKPGSVGHRLLANAYVTAIPLGQCLHIASSNLPGRRA